MSRFPRVAAVALTASLLISGGVAAQDTSPAPVVLEPVPGSLVHGVPGNETVSEYLPADPSIVDPSPTSWERLEIGPDGQGLRVFFSTGADGCYGLARVEVDRSGDTPVVTVWTGLRPDAATRICDAMAYPYYTDVALDAPFVLDGSGLAGATDVPIAMGSGISIADVDAAPAGEVLLVNGSLLVGPDGELRLWEALTESDPPQGSGDSLLVTGLDKNAIDWNEAGGVRWGADVQLLGRVEDGVLVIDPLVK
jgi:hypothetical protein